MFVFIDPYSATAGPYSLYDLFLATGSVLALLFLYTTKYPITVSDSTVHSLIEITLSNMESKCYITFHTGKTVLYYLPCRKIEQET